MDNKDLIRRGDVLNLAEEFEDINPETGEGIVYRAVEADAVNSIPAADAVEVRHGLWLVTDAYPHNVYCSECFKTYVQEHWQIWQDKPGDGGIERNYCPHCGARMDGRREDGDA